MDHGENESSDDMYLYGEERARAIGQINMNAGISDEPSPVRQDVEHVDEAAMNVDGDTSEEEVSDDDDDVEIVMDEPGDEPAQQSLITLTADTKVAGKEEQGGGANKIDINQVGVFDDKPIYNVELDSIDDKGWRKPGADITDYFNFGFDETSWRQYCHKQQMLRQEYVPRKIQVHESADDRFRHSAGRSQSARQGQGAARRPQQPPRSRRRGTERERDRERDRSPRRRY